MVFGRGRKAKQEQPADTGDSAEPEALEADAATDRDAAVRSAGPYDVSEIENQDGYVDLGALLIAPREGLQLRLEVEEATQRVVAVTMDLDGSSLQLQAFAAPRSEGLWDEIREQIGQSVGSQGGQVDEIEGHFGIELVAKLPAGDGSEGYRVARFFGVDGPRWFLRAAPPRPRRPGPVGAAGPRGPRRGRGGGPPARPPPPAAGLEELFRQIVVVRGENPMPPRDLLQLRLPRDTAAAAPQGAPEFEQPERGPEITQIG